MAKIINHCQVVMRLVLFPGAMFVHKRYGWEPAIIPYGMSLVAGWSRVEARAHYWHDVVAGAAIAALVTWGGSG